MRPINASINLSYIEHNLNQFKLIHKDSRFMAIVKANGYGHGAVKVAQHLHNSAEGFGVCSIEEALELRSAGITKKVLVLNGIFHYLEIEQIQENNIDIVIHNTWQLDTILKHKKNNMPLNVWLKVNSGLNRFGLNKNEFIYAYDKLISRNIRIEAIMSHLHSADLSLEKTLMQKNAFMQIVNNVDFLAKNIPLSLCASSACFYPDMKINHPNWIRTGIGIYVNQLENIPQNDIYKEITNGDIKFKNAMTLSSQIIAIRKIKVGDSTGYSHTWTAQKDSEVAIVAGGYADGIRRALSNTGEVYIKNKKVPIVGNISMDAMCIDVTGLGVKIGDTVEIWGNLQSVSSMAKKIGTIAHEMLTSISKRVHKIYTI